MCLHDWQVLQVGVELADLDFREHSWVGDFDGRVSICYLRELLAVVMQEPEERVQLTLERQGLPCVDVASEFPRGLDGDVSVTLPFLVSAFITAVPSISLAIAASDKTRIRRSSSTCSRKIILGRSVVPPFSWARRSMVVLFLARPHSIQVASASMFPNWGGSCC